VDRNITALDFSINANVKSPSKNTIVLQRRQSVRQALSQNQLQLSLQAHVDMPKEVVTGDLIRVR
jgi:hypothetical protein